MKSQAEAKRACPSFPYCASTILQLGLTATNGQEQGQTTEVEPGPLTPFHSILFENLLSWILGSCLMVLFSWTARPLILSWGRQDLHLHSRVLWFSHPSSLSSLVVPWLELLALGCWLLGGLVLLRSRLPCSSPADVPSQITWPSEVLKSCGLALWQSASL